MDDPIAELAKHVSYEWILSILLLAVAIIVANKRLGAWATFSHQILAVTFRFRFRINRIGIRLVTLDDYVALLERLRERLKTYCDSHADLAITVYVFTMQLPSDWPLWASDATPRSSDKTALEHYFFNFDQFLTEAREHQRKIDVKRIIVVENCDAPAGRDRVLQLQKDAQSSYCSKYISMLHGGADQALVYLTERPWPGWLSDAVFYGVRKAGGSSEWLWGVTTSYRAGEDLLLLRFHRINNKQLSSRFILPWGEHSLAGLLRRASTPSALGMVPLLEFASRDVTAASAAMAPLQPAAQSSAPRLPSKRKGAKGKL